MSFSAVSIDLAFDDDMNVIASWDVDDQLASLQGWRLVEAGGLPIERRSDLLAQRTEPFDLTFVKGEELRSLSWVSVRSFSEVATWSPEDTAGVPFDVLGGGEITTVEGEPVLNQQALEELIATQGKARMLLTVRGEDGVSRDVAVQWLDTWLSAARHVAGWGFAAIGLACFRWRPSSRTVRAFLLFCLCCAAFWWLRAIDFNAKSQMERYTFFVLRALLPVAAFNLFLNFTPMRRTPVQARLALAVVAATSFAIALGAWLTVPSLAKFGLLGVRLSVAWFGFVLLIVLFTGVAVAYVRRARGATNFEIQRARALQLAVLVSLAPLALHWLARVASSDRMDFGQFTVELTVLLFPLVLGYAVVKHNLFQLDELLLHGLTYGAVALVLSAVFAVAVATVVPLSRLIIPAEATGATFVLVALAAFVASPIHHSVRKRVERRLHESTDQLTTLAELSTISDAQSLPQDFCRTLVRELAADTSSEHVALFFRHPETGQWWLGASTDLLTVADGAEELRSVFERIEAEKGEIFRDDIDENVDATISDYDVLRGMDAIGATVALPMIVADEVWGALFVGEKVELTNFSGSDVKTLRVVAQNCAARLREAYWQANGLSVPDTSAPEQIGAYRIRLKVGEGAMASVFWAEAADGSDVAVKVIKPGPLLNPKLVERFQREARILQELAHPNVIQVLDRGVHEHAPFLVLEYFRESSLRDLIDERGSLPVDQACRIAVATARGLSVALERGIVHRDVNPRNIFVDEHRDAVVADFGIAHIDDATQLTTSDQVLGTPAYMSPEACLGEEVGWHGDQYSLGITLFEMLTGRRPFHGQRRVEIFSGHLHGVVPALTDLRDDVPQELERVVETMLAKKPEERFESYDSLVSSFRSLGLVRGER